MVAREIAVTYRAMATSLRLHCVLSTSVKAMPYAAYSGYVKEHKIAIRLYKIQSRDLFGSFFIFPVIPPFLSDNFKLYLGDAKLQRADLYIERKPCV